MVLLWFLSCAFVAIGLNKSYMKKVKKLNNIGLDNDSGGNIDLEKYLISLQDKELIDRGTGIKLDIDPSTHNEKAGQLIVVKCDKYDA